MASLEDTIDQIQRRRHLANSATRKRVAQDSDEEAQSPGPKKPRTRAPVHDDVVASTSREVGASPAQTRSGLLTPEPSTLTESQVAPTSTTSDIDPKNIFPFMKLPAELRIHIYHMALVREAPLLLHADRLPADSSTPEDPTAYTPRALRPSPAYAPGTSFHRPRASGPERVPLEDPIVPEILRLNKTIYREARQVLYSDNVFTLSLTSGIYTLSTLHQRSRSLIKHVVLTIPSHHDILDGFADLVRLGLRYCWGLKTFKIILQASLPDDGRVSGATSVYANAFHILRWLPRGCNVGLEGNVSEAVKRVVQEEGRLQSVLDEASYLKRQHQMPERH
ncbi:hypothetical protein G6011_06033 [Alternaria panax]|uniref:Uncharacterized protein n=1 Tax=Alternaria panax TaxID=48097 RepID=A0AAD4I537_9PLEO|nr:hypothetical protein G6011_06033 [Alternaria panax]